MSWVIDERGLGGGNERDGLAWVLPLETLWEGYVESIYKKEAAETGGEVKVGRLGETIFPINWSDSTFRTLGHLVPDVVIRHGNSIQIVDAKYKAHFAEIDELGWHKMEQEIRDSHRADLHQVLAYASLFDAEEIIATLVYPLRKTTFSSLLERGQDRSYANLYHGGRHIKLELRGLPFGSMNR
jgi:5-methylcytosine-specific restriction endonuclease McrBC regulatory subunit McrC